MSTENTDALQAAGQADSPHAAHAESVSIDSVVDVAIKHFSRSGFAETKLEAIAQESGMSKRMIHYHFGDKKGLYLRALSTAAQRLNPPQDALEIDTAVPVEGVRKLVDWLFRERVANPDAIRMLVWESNQQIVDPAQQAIADVAGVALHLDRLLLLGQDAGAFRPGISANDIFTLISSLTVYRVTNQVMVENMLGVNFNTQENIDGMHRLTVDAVLAFLTANIPDSGHESYLTSSSFDTKEGDEASPQDIYSEE